MTTINIYSKEQTDALLAGKQGALTASDGVAITNGNIAHTNAVTPQTTGAGSATQIPVFTYDAQGHITGVTPTTVNATNDVDGNAIKTTYMKVADFHTIGGNYGSDNPVTTQYFVNSSIATNTANFIGTYDVVTDLGLTTSATTAQVETALNAYMSSHSITPTNNDYAFVYYDLATDPGNVDRYERYKYSASGTPGWVYEYTLNNSSFTAVQWEAINSGINSTKVTAYDGYATSKQDTLVVGTNMDANPTQNSTYPVTSGGVYSAINTCAKLSEGTDISPQTFTGYNQFGKAIIGKAVRHITVLSNNGRYHKLATLTKTRGWTNATVTFRLSWYYNVNMNLNQTSEFTLAYVADENNITNGRVDFTELNNGVNPFNVLHVFYDSSKVEVWIDFVDVPANTYIDLELISAIDRLAGINQNYPYDNITLVDVYNNTSLPTGMTEMSKNLITPTLFSNNTFTGINTFNGDVIVGKNHLKTSATGSNKISNILESIELGVTTGANYYGGSAVYDKNGSLCADIQYTIRNNADSAVFFDVMSLDANNASYTSRMEFWAPKGNPNDCRLLLQRQRDFNVANTKDVVTIGTLIQALRYYNLIS